LKIEKTLDIIMNFEEKLQRIDQLIQVINKSGETLENQISAYEEGLKLINECREFLTTTEKKIIDISKKMNNADQQNWEEEN